MTERIEEVRRGGSWMPWAMVAAFTLGAAAAGWFIFADDIKSWTRVEDVTWTPQAGEHLTLVQRQRWSHDWVNENSEDVVTAELVWTVVPSEATKVPGEEATWTQSLTSARIEHRATGAPTTRYTWPEPKGAAQDLSALPDWAHLLSPIVALDLGTHVGKDGDEAASVTAPEVLQQIALREAGATVPRNTPLPAERAESLNDQLGWFVQDVAIDIAGLEAGRPSRPGQMWTRNLKMTFGPWAAQTVHAEVHTTGYKGNVANLQARFSRAPTDAALNPEAGMSFLKGTAEYRFDVARHVPLAGHMQLEAQGKQDRRFLKIDVERSFALASGGKTPTIPAAWALPAVTAAARHAPGGPAPSAPAPHAATARHPASSPAPASAPAPHAAPAPASAPASHATTAPAPAPAPAPRVITAPAPHATTAPAPASAPAPHATAPAPAPAPAPRVITAPAPAPAPAPRVITAPAPAPAPPSTPPAPTTTSGS